MLGGSGESGVEIDCGGAVASSVDFAVLERGVSPAPINAKRFYAEYHSHRIEHLVALRKKLVDQGCKRFVYFIGDSTLDNKHWFFEPFQVKEAQMFKPAFTAEALNGYETALKPKRMVQDVAYHMNAVAAAELGPTQLCTIMTSIEESTIAERDRDLLVQDKFVQHYLTAQDYLVVSMGGNDVALKPTLRTAVNMMALLRSPECMIRSGLAPGFGYFVHMFHSKILNVLKRVTRNARPAKVLVCMLYYLDETPGGSWADVTLSALGYDKNPAKLQLAIRSLFTAIKKRGFDLPGTSVEYVPLFETLDGKDHSDYCQRVEPSVSGGRKMAEEFMRRILADVRARQGSPSYQHPSCAGTIVGATDTCTTGAGAGAGAGTSAGAVGTADAAEGVGSVSAEATPSTPLVS